MNWESWSQFINMGGYAPYVWGSVLTAVCVVFTEVVFLRMRWNTTLRRTKHIVHTSALINDEKSN